MRRGVCIMNYKFKEKLIKLPTNPKLKERARELRKQGVLSEVLFWNEVKRKKFLGLDFDRQKIIGNFIVDFYVKRLGIVIEIDGESHNQKKEKDKYRDEFLNNLGLTVIRYSDKDVKFNLDGVFSDLKSLILTEFVD